MNELNGKLFKIISNVFISGALSKLKQFMGYMHFLIHRLIFCLVH